MKTFITAKLIEFNYSSEHESGFIYQSKYKYEEAQKLSKEN